MDYQFGKLLSPYGASMMCVSIGKNGSIRNAIAYNGRIHTVDDFDGEVTLFSDIKNIYRPDLTGWFKIDVSVSRRVEWEYITAMEYVISAIFNTNSDMERDVLEKQMRFTFSSSHMSVFYMERDWFFIGEDLFYVEGNDFVNASIVYIEQLAPVFFRGYQSLANAARR